MSESINYLDSTYFLLLRRSLIHVEVYLKVNNDYISVVYYDWTNNCMIEERHSIIKYLSHEK